MKLFALMLISAFLAAFPLSREVTAAETYTDYINACIVENVAEGYEHEKVIVYCVCMDQFIPDGETLSIEEWSKTHPDEDAACVRKAGW